MPAQIATRSLEGVSVLEPITPQEYFEGQQHMVRGAEVVVGASYMVRLTLEAPINVHGVHGYVNGLPWASSPVEGLFRIDNIRECSREGVVGFAWANCGQVFRIALDLLESGQLKSVVKVVGYIAAKAEEEEPESDPSLNRDRPLVAA